MKKYLVLVLVLVLIAGCASQTTQQPSTEGNGQPINDVKTGNVKEFDITAKKFEFIPGTIKVNKGDLVKLHIKSVDVTHGFALPDFGINENLEPGKEVNVEFTADKEGTFTFYCSVYCGSGHGGMKGTLVVE